MGSEVLVSILLLVSIVAVILLAAVFWRLYDILGDVKTVSRLSAKRAEQIDKMLSNLEQTVYGYLDAAKGFMSSVGFVKVIKSFFDKYKKGDQNGEEE